MRLRELAKKEVADYEVELKNEILIEKQKIDETNCIATIKPELAKYFVNKMDAYKYSINSGKRVKCKCINCEICPTSKRFT